MTTYDPPSGGHCCRTLKTATARVRGLMGTTLMPRMQLRSLVQMRAPPDHGYARSNLLSQDQLLGEDIATPHAIPLSPLLRFARADPNDRGRPR